MVVELDPVADRAACMCQALEPLAVHALLLQRSDEPLHHAVLLWTVGRDELLAQAVAVDQCGLLARR